MTPSEYSKLQQIYGSIELNEEEEKVAILEGKISKYFREKHAPHWKESENQQPNETEKLFKNQADAPNDKAVKDVLQKRVKERWGKAHKAKKFMQ